MTHTPLFSVYALELCSKKMKDDTKLRKRGTVEMKKTLSAHHAESPRTDVI